MSCLTSNIEVVQLKITNLLAILSVLITVPVVLLAGNYRYYSKVPIDIVDTAISAKSFNTLVAALEAADLVDVLRGEGPFSVFAPTDDAFAKLPAGTLDNLPKPENKVNLRAILAYHVLPGRYAAADVIKMNSAKTVNGQSLTISETYGNVMIDNARITGTDFKTRNGVIHVVDSVILPEGM